MDWWKSRSIKELRELSNAGLSGSGLCEGAALELERRALEERRRQQELLDDTAREQKKYAMRRIIIAASLVGGLFALALLLKLLLPMGGPSKVQLAERPALEASLPRPGR
jgi:hypothetical protein